MTKQEGSKQTLTQILSITFIIAKCPARPGTVKRSLPNFKVLQFIVDGGKWGIRVKTVGQFKKVW